MVATPVATTFASHASRPSPKVVAASMVKLTTVEITDTPMQRTKRVMRADEGARSRAVYASMPPMMAVPLSVR